jgi:hypothetical protein
MVVIYLGGARLVPVADAVAIELTWPRHQPPGAGDEVRCLDRAGRVVAAFSAKAVVSYRLGTGPLAQRER